MAGEWQAVRNLKVRKSVDIEQLIVWALVDNGLGRAFGGETKINWMDWGVRPDNASSAAGWGRSMPGVKHDDAIRVAHAIEQLPVDMAQIIIRYGRIGDRPDWVEDGVGHWQQMVDGQGRPMWKWADDGNRSRKRSERTPRMEFIGETQSNVDFYRAQYDVWWIALDGLVEPLNAVMDDHEATAPRAPDRPWLKPSKVFSPDGSVMTGLHDRAARTTPLSRRGNIKEPEHTVDPNIHSSGSPS